MPRVDVDIAIVTRGPEVLICQRHADNTFGGCWEFPGGKREPGESAEACVVREVREEVGIAVRPRLALTVIEHDYPHARIRQHPFICDHLDGEPQLLACQDARWVTPLALRDYRFPPANEPLIEQAIEHLTRPRTPR